MTITFRDEGGYVAAQVNNDGVSFCDGFAYFTVENERGDEDYKISVENVSQIVSWGNHVRKGK